jgi:hypothetical protein
MVNCACGKPLEKVPSWLSGTTIQFVCNNCPNRTVKAITQVSLEPARDPDAEETGALEAAFAEEEEDIED